MELALAFRGRLEEALEAARRLTTTRPLLGPSADLERLPLARWATSTPRPSGLAWPLEIAEGVQLAERALPAAAERLAERLSSLAEELLDARYRKGALKRILSGDGLAERPFLRWRLRGDGAEARASAEEAALEAVLEWYEGSEPRRWPDAAEPAAVRDWLSSRQPTREAEALAWFILSRVDLAWLYLAERAERLDAEDWGHAERMARGLTERFLADEDAARECLRETLSELAEAGDTHAARILDTPERFAALAVELLGKAREVGEPIVAAEAEIPAEGLLSWDAELLEQLENLGAGTDHQRERSTERASRWRGDAPVLPGFPEIPAWEVFRLWRLPHSRVPPWGYDLARALWSRWRWSEEEDTRRDAERRRRQRLYGGVSVLPLAVAGGLTEGGLDARRYRGGEDGDQLRLFIPDRLEVARIDLRIYREIAERLAEAPPAVDALLSFAIDAGFRRWREMPEDGLSDADILIRGGKRGLRELLGCSPSDAEYALEWGQSLHLPRIDVRGLWLWNGSYQRQAPGREAMGLLQLQKALLPRSEQHYQGRDAYFVPWTSAPPLPDLRPWRGAYLRFWRFLSVALASASAEGRLLEGGVLIPEERLRGLAKQAGLDWPRAKERLRGWVEEGALTRDGDLWRLGELFERERKLLEGNQRTYEAARKGGLAKAAAAESGRTGKARRARKADK